SHPSRARTRTDAPRVRSSAPAPDHDAAAERKASYLDADDACPLPELELAFERVGLPERADRAAEEVADLAPAVPQHSTCERQPGAHVQLPRRPRDPLRHPELERRHDPARPNDPSELLEDRAGVGDVAQEVRERQVVERRSVEGERFRRRLDELDALAEP